MANEKANAIVIRIVEFSETSIIATLFTDRFGKISALAKGARRPKSPFEAALDLLAACRIVFIHKSTDALDLLTEAKLERRFRSASRDLTRLYAGFYVAELLNELTDPGDPHPSVFEVANQSLLKLDQGGGVSSTVLRFEMTLLRELGLLPSLQSCVGCGQPIHAGKRVAFGMLAGGVLCDRCRPEQRQVVSVSNEVMDILRHFAEPEDESGHGDEIDRRHHGELRGLLNHYMAHVLGHRPKMQKYLGVLKGLAFALWFALGAAMPGCATLQAERDAVARYERTREELDRAARGEIDRPAYEEAARKKTPLELSDLAPENWKDTFFKLVGQGPSSTKAEASYRQAQAIYEEAVQLRNQGNTELASAKFISAGDQFTESAKHWPKSTLEQNSLFFAGESYFFADYYVKASDSYEKLLKEHPNSRHLDEVQKRRFSIAQFWLDTYNKERPQFYDVNLTDNSRPWQGLFSRAMKVYDRIRLDDPTGKLADDATLALANAHFAEKDYIKADEYYTDLRKTFPSSEHQFTAHFIGLKSKLLNYQGPEYSGAVLDEADKLIDTIRRQFPMEAERERDYLVRAKAEVRYRQAEREWVMAEYFNRKTQYGAAKFYYAVIMRDFPDTSFAERTKERLVEIGGLPDVPAQRFEWLVDLFPREDDVRPLIATDKPKTKKR